MDHMVISGAPELWWFLSNLLIISHGIDCVVIKALIVMVLLHKMMMVTLLNTMMLITKVLLAAKPDCNWFASTQLPYLLAGGHHLTLVLVSMMMMIAMMMMMAMVPWTKIVIDNDAGVLSLSHSEALIEHFMTQHRYFALIAVEVNK